MTIYRHKKRGTLYEFGGIAKVQTNDWFYYHDNGGHGSVDMKEVVVYRNIDKPDEVWVRPREEFFDGRFEEME